MSRALVVVSYGSSALLAENLAAWGRASTPGWTVVVVDNPTTTEERARVRSLADQHGWLLVEPDHNLGFGDGCAAGVAAARTVTEPNAIVLLNPDARVSVEDADELARRVEEDESLLLVPQMVHGDGRPAFTIGYVDRRTGMPTGAASSSGLAWLTGACLAMARGAWETLGGFASDYFLYWEDVDVAWRWHAAGGRVDVARDLRCVHDAGGTQAGAGSPSKSPLYYFFNTRNRLVFAARNLGARGRVRWALHSPRYARQVVLRGGRRQLLRPWRCVVPAVRGTVSGLRALVVGLPATTPRAATPQVGAPSAG
ncbi:GT2 family glycosyltransferase [Flavimobilis soli]|uniref:GT2 family glycosyltransferase n=1 Tax=Flavimobilis soli TaxID=442709 RepID=A0A2A9EF06_9MICO|nr:glycosyltransferase family 2 protein [Flavimobilis soli]PFG37508.1 GT2 family glycosyltransferase [Flavimobilis soli]